MPHHENRKRIKALHVTENATVEELVERLGASSYQARTLAEACRIFEEMLKRSSAVCLTLAGAMTPAGIGGYIADMIRRGFIDIVITTGANATHDTHFPLDTPVTQGSPDSDDAELREAGIERVYDTYLDPSCLTVLGEALYREFLPSWKGARETSSPAFYRELGKFLSAKARQELRDASFLIAASEFDVPVFTPAFGDSEIGMDCALFELDNPGKAPVVNPNLDVLELTALVFAAEKTGVIAVGGGSPKNFFTQTAPLLEEDIYMPDAMTGHEGHDYIIKITTDVPEYGGCSGATPSENISWKKLDPSILGSGEIVVHADATIALPVLFQYVASRVKPREPKRLFAKIPEARRKLEEARMARRKRFGQKSYRIGVELDGEKST